MIERPERTVIICDGGVASAVALAAAREARVQTRGKAAAVWIDAGLDGLSEARDRAARSMAKAMGCDVLGPDEPFADGAASGAQRVVMLIVAGTASCAAGRPEIVWPVLCATPGDPSPTVDAARVGREMDRAVLVTRLLSLDAPEHGQVSASVTCPLADVPDQGVAELAVDLAAPVERCWWVNQAGPEADAERSRWTELLRRCGHAGV